MFFRSPNSRIVTGCILLLISAIGLALYFAKRDQVFPVVQNKFALLDKPTQQELRDILQPWGYDSNQIIEFEATVFVDRPAIKYISDEFGRETLDRILETDHIGLWGWNIEIQSPKPIRIQISQNKKLIGLQFLQENFLQPGTVSQWKRIVQRGLSKDLSTYKKQSLFDQKGSQELLFQRTIRSIEVLEKVSIVISGGVLRNFESKIFLPQEYAQITNAGIQTQKTIHQIFQVLHYILIGFVFFVLFRLNEFHPIDWKKNSSIFFIFIFSQFFSDLFKTNFHDEIILSFVQVFLKTVVSSFWLYPLVVVADYACRSYQRSQYALTDLTRRSFLCSSFFRESLIVGWLLAVGQLLFVFFFYGAISKASFYIPEKIPGEHSTYCSIEFLNYFFSNFSISFYEEILYRVFFILTFISLFKRPFLVVMASSVLWGFLHISHQFEPFFVRGIELSLIGIVYGFTMLRYGVLPPIVAHFLYNSLVSAEYESQFLFYTLGLSFTLFFMVFLSWLFRKSCYFSFKRTSFPIWKPRELVSTDRRSNENPAPSMFQWKYGFVVAFFIAVLPLSYFFLRFEVNPMADQKEIVTLSQELVEPYLSSAEIWSIAYRKTNPDIQHLRESAKQLPAEERKKAIDDLQKYSFVWSVRIFDKKSFKRLCDIDYSDSYEVLGIRCDVQEPLFRSISLEEWLFRLKNPKESWTLLHKNKMPDDMVMYQFVVSEAEPFSKVISFVFSRGQLVSFQKDLQVGKSFSKAENQNSLQFASSMALSITFVFLLICFSRLFLEKVRKYGVFERKALVGSILTSIIYLLSSLNGWKNVLVLSNTNSAMYYDIINHVVYSVGTCFMLGAATYVLLFSFFHFPGLVFRQAPTSQQWDKILKRPIWMWRNTKSSLLFAIGLIFIQLYFRLLLQMNEQVSILDVFHFDIEYLNHEYLFISFFSVLWKTLLFWIILLAGISAMERYMSRWIYLPMIGIAITSDIVFSGGQLNSKVLELLGVFFVVYFIYRFAKFDFAFYVWFVVLQTLVTFLPVLFFPKFEDYFYQVFFITLFVFLTMFYTFLLRPRVRVVKVEA